MEGSNSVKVDLAEEESKDYDRFNLFSLEELEDIVLDF